MSSEITVHTIPLDGINDITFLDGEISKAYDAIGSIEQYILLLKKQRNSVLPINSLPAELLLRIFNIVRKSGACSVYESWPRRDWLCVTKVCHLWREISLDCSMLWDKIKATHGTGFDTSKACAFFERSRNVEIDIIMDGDIASTNPGFVKLIKVNLPRARVLDICLRDKEYFAQYDIEVFIVESSPLTRLKKLFLKAHRNARDRKRRLEILSRWVPAVKLEELHLEELYFPWRHGVYQGLQVLSLKKLSDAGPSVGELLQILEHCKGLRELSLDGAGPQINESEVDHFHLINLPCLRRFFLLNVDCHAYVKLMEHIQIDLDDRNDTQFEFNFNHSINRHFTLLPEHQLNLISSTHAEIMLIFIKYTLSLQVFLSSAHSRLEKPPISFSFEIGQYPDREVLAELSEIFQMKHIRSICTKSVRLFLEDSRYRELYKKSGWMDLFQSIPDIKRLEIVLPGSSSIPDQGLKDFVSALSAEKSHYAEPHHFLCPELEEILLDDFDISKNFFESRNIDAYMSLIDHLENRSIRGKRLQRLSLIPCDAVEDGTRSRIMSAVDELLLKPAEYSLNWQAHIGFIYRFLHSRS